MELDELIKVYRESGAVVAKLSLGNDWSYTFLDICEQEPALLEIFNITNEKWVEFLQHVPHYKHLCDLTKFRLAEWLQLVKNQSIFFEHVDFLSYSHEDYEGQETQIQLRGAVMYYAESPKALEKLPVHYLNEYQTLKLLKSYPDLKFRCDPQTVWEILPKLEQFRVNSGEIEDYT